MIVVLFEVQIKTGFEDEYIELARTLSEYLQDFEGFMGVERFRSLTDASKLLSLSFWADDRAIEAWRTLEEHRAAQTRGRFEIISNYTLRIANINRSYGMNDRDEAPVASRAAHG